MKPTTLVRVTDEHNHVVFRGSVQQLWDTIPSLAVDTESPNAYRLIEAHFAPNKVEFYRSFHIITVGEALDHLVKFDRDKPLVVIAHDRYTYPEPVVHEQIVIGLGSTDKPCPILHSDDPEWVHKFLNGE